MDQNNREDWTDEEVASHDAFMAEIAGIHGGWQPLSPEQQKEAHYMQIAAKLTELKISMKQEIMEQANLARELFLHGYLSELGRDASHWSTSGTSLKLPSEERIKHALVAGARVYQTTQAWMEQHQELGEAALLVRQLESELEGATDPINSPEK